MPYRELQQKQLELRLLYQASIKAGIRWSWKQFIKAITVGSITGAITVVVLGPTTVTITIPGIGPITMTGIAAGAVVGAACGGVSYFLDWLINQIPD